MKRLYVHGLQTPELRTVPLEPLPAGWARVRTRAVAVNPVDLNSMHLGYCVGSGMGCDFSGEVVELGALVTRVQIGSTVAGGAPGDDAQHPSSGCFSDYVDVPADSLFVLNLEPGKGTSLPFGPVTTFEQAASLAHGIFTAALSVCWYNKLELKPKRRHGFSLIYGASSTLGFYAAQLYKYLGYRVILVGSRDHWKLFDAIGIFLRVDYHDDDWVEQVQAIGGDNIVHAYDCISLGKTFENVFKCCSRSQPVVLNSALPISHKYFPRLGPNVEYNTPIYFLLWRLAYSWGGWTSCGDDALLRQRPSILERLDPFLERVVALPINVAGEGLESVPKALQILQKGVNAEKVVVRI